MKGIFTPGVWLVSMLAGALDIHAQVNPQTGFHSPPASQQNPFYPGNRPPLQPSPFIKLPIGAITPRGWLRRQLELDAAGMCGNLTKVSGFIQDGCAWANPTGEGHHGWEEPMYWLRGYADLGYVLHDPEINAVCQRWIDAMIASQRPDGDFGPKELMVREKGKPQCWPQFLAVNVLRSYYDAKRDPRVLDHLTKYFKWVGTLQDEDFHRSGLDKIRAVEQIANIYWLYNRTGQPWLLNLAKRIHQNTANWMERRPTPHNVDIAMSFREPAEFWQQSGEASHLAATHARYDEVMAEFGQFPGGGFAADENISHRFDPRQGFETCGFAEFMHSFQILTRIEADPVWADRCEEIAFNSYPAALTPDHKGLHYVTCANMVSDDFRNRRATFCNGWVKTGFSPTEDYRCCQHNHGIAWPYYAEELWLATADRGLCASLYAASDVTAKVGNGTDVTIREETDYPFGEVIRFKLATQKPVKFSLYLRVPRWCTSAQVAINGTPVSLDATPLTYLTVNRLWQTGDTVTLALPMHLQTKTWEKNQNSLSVGYGPVWFSLKIGEDWQKVDRKLADWPAWEVYPTTPWNYGLIVDGSSPEKSFKLVKKAGQVSNEPFTHESAPIELLARARRIPEWTIGKEKWITPLQPSPAMSREPIETVSLIPMGAARLRICSFPTVGSDTSAHAWQAVNLPPAAAFKVSASHTRDSLEAPNDGLAPDRSNDGGMPRLTWWDHKGTTEWLQYDFDKPRSVSSTSVFWFDDGNAGLCRTPAAWRILYLADGRWKPVKLTEGQWKALEGHEEYAAKKDEYNAVRFEEVKTEGLRLEVKLQENYSGGVFEWKVNE